MTAKIIRLDDYRVSQIRCSQNGVVFPQIYRCTGSSWKLREGETLENYTTLLPSDDEHIFYTLLGEDDGTFANPKFEPLTRLDPSIDEGWVMLRHHQNHAEFDGFIYACVDLDRGDSLSQIGFETDQGLFTLVHRPAKAGCKDCLLVYTTMVAHPNVGLDHWTKVIDSDSNELDRFTLYPPDPDDLM
jgi:hypothetical protein